MLEKNLQAYFIKKVNKAGGQAFKVNCDGRRGFPDLVVILDCVIWLVEMKQENGRLSVHQKRLHRDLREQSITVHVISTKQEADEFIRDFHYNPY